MTLQEKLRSIIAKDLIGDMTLPTSAGEAMYSADDRIDDLEGMLTKIGRWAGRQGYLDIRNNVRAALAQPAAKEESKE